MFVLLLFDDGYLLARKQRHQPVRRVAVGSHSGSIYLARKQRHQPVRRVAVGSHSGSIYVGIDSFLGQKQPVIQGL